MDEMLTDLIKQGMVNLRQLLAGKHLRPAELALTMVIVASQTELALDILLDSGKQARWENVNGEA